jgi:hypothetical protein
VNTSRGGHRRRHNSIGQELKGTGKLGRVEVEGNQLLRTGKVGETILTDRVANFVSKAVREFFEEVRAMGGRSKHGEGIAVIRNSERRDERNKPGKDFNAFSAVEIQNRAAQTGNTL